MALDVGRLRTLVTQPDLDLRAITLLVFFMGLDQVRNAASCGSETYLLSTAEQSHFGANTGMAILNDTAHSVASFFGMPRDVSDELVLYAVENHVARIALNRPDRMNAISRPMLKRLVDCLLRAEADPDVRVVVLTGEGSYFCVGLDLVSASNGGEDDIGPNARMSPSLDLRSTPPTVLFNMDKPTICALNGSAAGYGLDTALGCDIRVMASSAKMAVAFTKRGVVPESGGTWLLPRLVGWSKAAELIFTGRTLPASECLDLGLVSQVVPDGELQQRVAALAAEIAANAPLAVQASKRMMRMGLTETFNDHVHHVYLQLLPLLKSEDAREGMRAFIEKRKASFQGR